MPRSRLSSVHASAIVAGAGQAASFWAVLSLVMLVWTRLTLAIAPFMSPWVSRASASIRRISRPLASRIGSFSVLYLYVRRHGTAPYPCSEPWQLLSLASVYVIHGVRGSPVFV